MAGRETAPRVPILTGSAAGRLRGWVPSDGLRFRSADLKWRGNPILRPMIQNVQIAGIAGQAGLAPVQYLEPAAAETGA